MGFEPTQLAVNDHLTPLLPEADSKHILTAIYQVLVASRTSGLFNMTWIQSIFMYFSCHPCNFRHRNHISTQVLAVRFSSKNEITSHQSKMIMYGHWDLQVWEGSRGHEIDVGRPLELYFLIYTREFLKFDNFLNLTPLQHRRAAKFK